MQAATAWLDARPRLGRDAFARGMPEGEGRAPGGAPARAADFAALLRACLVALAVPGGQEVYRPAPSALWRVQDALACMRRLLGELPEGGTLARFLPEVAPEAPDHDLRCRAAVASTLVAGLELARGGEVTLGQEEDFGAVRVRATSGTTSTGVIGIPTGGG